MTRKDRPDMRKRRPRPSTHTSDPDYARVHRWVRKTFKKEGVCVRCGRSGYTQWSWKDHAEPLRTGTRSDWEELCRFCHEAKDGSHPGRRASSALRDGGPVERFKLYRLNDAGEKEEIATAADAAGVGQAIVQLGREGMFEGSPLGVLDTEGDIGKKWLVRPWLPSPKNVSDAGRVLATARKGEK